MVSAGPNVHLPGDEAPHHDPVEWWYFNGHLSGTGPGGQVRCFGFEYVTFQFLGLTPLPAYVGNFAVTDLARRSFSYGSQLASYRVPVSVGHFSFRTGPWSMAGGSGKDTLQASLPGYQVHLRLVATEPAVLEGDDGEVSMGGFGSSKYYSWTSLATTGTLVDHGVTMTVSGLSWMDHQWGTMDLYSGAGWDWFSVQLTDGQQYMLYFIRNRQGQVVSRFGARVSHDGRTTRLAAVSEKVTGHWRSPATGVTYSSGWQLSVPDGHLEVTPDLLDQEVDLRSTQGNAYWEGDVSVSGTVAGSPVSGVGYTEINPTAAAGGRTVLP
jgi:predicted secreted hydrolase